MNDQELVLKTTEMETMEFDKLLLKTAFSCMACDGVIDSRELNVIKQLHQENRTFGMIDMDSELDALLLVINQDGNRFLKDYFNELTSFELSEANELNLIKVAISTIEADEKVEYSEIKFFKVIRSKLKISNESILTKHPEFEEYLEEDIISETYLSRLQDDIFGMVLPKFEPFNEIGAEALDGLKQNNEE